jgi:hypothetical protein
MKPAYSLLVVLVLASLAEARAEEPRDPMRPPTAQSRGSREPARETAPVLSAVMTFHGKRTAIFNGRLVHDGSVVGAYTIDSVLEDGVRYRNGRVSHEMHLPHPESPIKKPAAESARSPSGESP